MRQNYVFHSPHLILFSLKRFNRISPTLHNHRHSSNNLSLQFRATSQDKIRARMLTECPMGVRQVHTIIQRSNFIAPCPRTVLCQILQGAEGALHHFQSPLHCPHTCGAILISLLTTLISLLTVTIPVTLILVFIHPQ